jgi:hypothetical protein
MSLKDAKQAVIDYEYEVPSTCWHYGAIIADLLKHIERLEQDCIVAEQQIMQLKAMLRINILRWYPNMSHEEVEESIDNVLKDFEKG